MNETCPWCSAPYTRYGCGCRIDMDTLRADVEFNGISWLGTTLLSLALAGIAVVSMCCTPGRAKLGKTPTHTIIVTGTAPDDKDAGD